MTHITVIPAEPGYITVLALQETLTLGDALIAWRIDSVARESGHRSHSVPITVLGSADASCVGVMNPDRTVTLFTGTTFATLADAQAGITAMQSKPV